MPIIFVIVKALRSVPSPYPFRQTSAVPLVQDDVRQAPKPSMAPSRIDGVMSVAAMLIPSMVMTVLATDGALFGSEYERTGGS